VKKGSGRGGSTTVSVDDVNKKVTIETCMEFQGAGATQAYADAAKKQIEDTWSGQMQRNGATYDVVVKVDAKVRAAGAPACANCDPILVDPVTNRMSQTLYGAGPGYQTPGAATDAARPRRIAHEYGHTLGLDDDYVDTPAGSVPKDPTRTANIMQQTWPEADGTLPHPYQDHYDQILAKHGW
jgi:hypothetical protein